MNNSSTDIDIRALTILRKRYLHERDELIKMNPHWDHQVDARCLVFSKSSHVISSALVGIKVARCPVFQDRELAHEAGFKYEDWCTVESGEFEIYIKAAFAQAAFAVHESALRHILRSLDPNAANSGAAAYESIYQALLKRVSLEPDTKELAMELFNIWRTIRNCIHNNFAYYHESKSEVDVAYRGKIYRFCNDRPVEFLTWKLFALMVADLGTVLLSLVRSPEIGTLPSVYDPVNVRVLSRDA